MRKISKWEARANACMVLDYFERFPEMHDQVTWYEVVGEGVSNFYAEKIEVDLDHNICNTTMCAAGTVMWINEGRAGLSYFNSTTEGIEKGIKRARKYLGLTDAEANTLFVETENDEAKKILERIANGKKNLFKGYPHLQELHDDYEPNSW